MSPPETPELAPVAGVVLAAGSSSRMGKNKLLLEVEGEPILRRSVRGALAAGLEPVIVVLGHEADRSRAALVGLACREVFNADSARGVHTSLGAGIRAVPPEAGAAVVLLADMPFVTADMISGVVEAYRDSGPALVISDYGGVQAPPTLYDRSLFAELLEAHGEGCGKRVVERHAAQAARVAWPAAALTDVDRPGDLERVRDELEAAGSAPRVTPR
jgi:molybdenum cofactor cytidylyltransferase